MTMTLGELLDLIGFDKIRAVRAGLDLSKVLSKADEERILRAVYKKR